MKRLWVLAICCASGVNAQFAGPDACRPCHLKQYTTQAGSRHALALRPILDTPLPQLLREQPLRERSGISFEYEPAAGGVLVKVAQADRAASALLEWAFGSGEQAFTPVGRIGGRFFEHRISYYSAAPGGRRTLGHPGAPSKDPQTALGIPQDQETIYRCFNCHATGVKPGPDLHTMVPGVTCERCHGSAAKHAAEGVRIQPISRLSRDRLTAICGECHRLPAPNASRTPEIEDPLSIRFAPVGLMASACYQKSGDLSCLTCHNPHEDASRDQASYTAKCIQCHEQPRHSQNVAKDQNCLTCHMQRRSPAPYLTFTDHRIRVYAND